MNMEGYDRLKQERDELAAQVEVMRDALNDARKFIVNGVALGYIRMPDKDTPDSAHNTLPNINSALSTAPSDALREIQAMTLEEAAAFVLQNMTYTQVWNQQTILQALANLAAAKRKG